MKSNITRSIYGLKMRYGLPAEYHHFQQDEQSIDFISGQISYGDLVIPVKRAIKFPTSIHTEHHRAMAYVAAAKNFVQGGEFETDITIFGFDTMDLFKVDTETLTRRVFTPTMNDRIVFDSQTFQVKKHQLFSEERMLIVHAKGVTDA